jgi:hypothetical protein
MAIKINVVLMGNHGRYEGWMREMLLPIPPFPGLGIRIDTYEMLNVVKVVIEDDGHSVTCFVGPEGPDVPGREPINAEAFGFRPSGESSQCLASSDSLRYIETMQERAKSAETRALQAGIFLWNDEQLWTKTIEVPFPPYVGLEFQLDRTRTCTVASMVVGDRHHDVTCITPNKGTPLSRAECDALGLEEALYPY